MESSRVHSFRALARVTKPVTDLLVVNESQNTKAKTSDGRTDICKRIAQLKT